MNISKHDLLKALRHVGEEENWGAAQSPPADQNQNHAASEPTADGTDQANAKLKMALENLDKLMAEEDENIDLNKCAERRGQMEEKRQIMITKKNIWAFVGGLLAGCLLCWFVLPHRYLYFPPVMDSVSVAFCKIDRLTGSIWVARLSKGVYVKWEKLADKYD